MGGLVGALGLGDRQQPEKAGVPPVQRHILVQRYRRAPVGVLDPTGPWQGCAHRVDWADCRPLLWAVVSATAWGTSVGLRALAVGAVCDRQRKDQVSDPLACRGGKTVLSAAGFVQSGAMP